MSFGISLKRTLLVIFSALVLFAGPTYFLYILDKLHISYPILDVVGISCLIIGIIVLRRLLKEEEAKIEAS